MILSDTLSAEDVYLMLDGMDKPVKRKELKEIVIRYNIAGKKTRLHLVFPRRGKSSAQSVVED